MQLNAKQLDRLSEFSGNLALVFLSALIIPVISGFDSPSPVKVVLGVVVPVLFLAISLILLKKKL